MKANIAFVSLGCDKNRVDSEVMLGILRERGYTIVSDETEADIIVVNTCCFIKDALEESIETIIEMAEYKKNGKCKGLIVSGCLAQRFEKLGYEVYATRSTADVLRQNGVDAIKVNKIHQEAPTVMDLLLEHKIDIVIDTPTQGRDKNRDGFLIRRTSIETGVNCFTSLDTVDALLTSLESNAKENLTLVDIATI